MFAVDYETYYDKKCSVVELGNRAYFEHPDFDAYMVSIEGPEFSFVGRPEDAPWDRMVGPGSHWLAHNASFDESIQKWLIEKGKIPAWALPETWDCTADMVAFFGVPRSLKAACKAVLGIDLSKETRELMSGQRWETMEPEFQQEVVDYALNDCIYCLKLWEKCGHLWPEHERRLSRQTRAIGWRGVPVNVEKLEGYIETMEQALITSLDRLPWARDGEKALSSNALAKACRAINVTPPSSVAVDNEECEEWKRRNDGSEAVAWVEAIQEYRSANALLKKLIAIRQRVFNGRMDFGLKYFGAHTGRWSGSSGVNMQNLPRGEMFGVKLRSVFEAPPGKVFVIADLSQIEPRSLHALAGDEEFIGRLRKSPDTDLYDVQARTWGLYNKPEPLEVGDPDTRHMTKTLNIGLGYCMKGGRFAAVTGMPLDQALAWVDFYQRKNPKICALWERLMGAFMDSVNSPDKTFHLGLPLRTLRYRNVNLSAGWTAIISKGRGFARQRVWSGILVENLVQAFARDVFADKLLKIEDAGWNIAWHVHDEVIVEVEEDRADECLASVLSIMQADVDWCNEGGIDLPLGAKGFISKVFKK